MHRSLLRIGAAIAIMSASATGAEAAGWRSTIDRWFAAQDKRMCRWDAPPGGGPACRITGIRDQKHSRGSLADKLNGWREKQEIRFDGVYYNGQLWSEVYDAIVIFVRTRDGWQLRYSSMGNGETAATAGVAEAR